MDVSRMRRPDELPFPVTENVAMEIDALIDAFARDDINLDCYMDELHGTLRELDPDEDRWCRWHYIEGGWKRWEG